MKLRILCQPNTKFSYVRGRCPLTTPARGANPLDPCERLTHRLSFPQFKMEWRPWISLQKREGCPPHFWWQSGKMSLSGNLKSVEEQAWNLWWKCTNWEFITKLREFYSFKTLKPMSFRGLRPLDPRCHKGISDENSTNWQFSAKLHVNVTPRSYPLKQVFLGGKSILQVPDTGTRVLDNTKPFLSSSIVSFWITPAHSIECKYDIFRQYWYTKRVPVFTNTGMFQYLGHEVYFFLLGFWNAKTNKLSGAEPLDPWHQGCGTSDIDLLWKWYKMRIHHKITCEFCLRFYPHKGVFLGFWIVKTHQLPGLRPRPLPGRWSLWWTVHGMRIYCEIISNKTYNQTSIQHHNKHA